MLSYRQYDEKVVKKKEVEVSSEESEKLVIANFERS